jgi:hypothetical protein
VQRTAFWLLAYVFFAVMLGPTLPSPLYVLYQAECYLCCGDIGAQGDRVRIKDQSMVRIDPQAGAEHSRVAV